MSRELDARVALEVMGFNDSKDCHHKPGDMLSPDGKIMTPPPYSTDMNAAMEVEQKMHDLGWCKSTLIHHLGGTWTAMFMNGPDLAEADADTAPSAICLAALEAVAQK